MQPHTAVNLKISSRNVMKDFIHVAGPLGVTHFVIVTATDKASYLKLCKIPRVCFSRQLLSSSCSGVHGDSEQNGLLCIVVSTLQSIISL
jgi:hypothetical protein